MKKKNHVFLSFILCFIFFGIDAQIDPLDEKLDWRERHITNGQICCDKSAESGCETSINIGFSYTSFVELQNLNSIEYKIFDHVNGNIFEGEEVEEVNEALATITFDELEFTVEEPNKIITCDHYVYSGSITLDLSSHCGPKQVGFLNENGEKSIVLMSAIFSGNNFISEEYPNTFDHDCIPELNEGSFQDIVLDEYQAMFGDEVVEGSMSTPYVLSFRCCNGDEGIDNGGDTGTGDGDGGVDVPDPQGGTGLYGRSVIVKKDITIRPNPFSDNLILNNLTLGDKVSLFDVAGKKVNTYTATESQVIISTENITSGIYLIRVDKLNGEFEINKVIKL